MNIELVKKIATFSNFESLKLETLKLLEVLKLEQISLQIKPNVINWSNSSGWLLNSKKEFEFNVIHPELKGSVFDEYLQSFPFEIYRTRIMVLQPFNSYSIHKDPTPRVHIPVVTDIKQHSFSLTITTWHICQQTDLSTELILLRHIPLSITLTNLEYT